MPSGKAEKRICLLPRYIGDIELIDDRGGGNVIVCCTSNGFICLFVYVYLFVRLTDSHFSYDCKFTNCNACKQSFSTRYSLSRANDGLLFAFDGKRSCNEASFINFRWIIPCGNKATSSSLYFFLAHRNFESFRVNALTKRWPLRCTIKLLLLVKRALRVSEYITFTSEFQTRCTIPERFIAQYITSRKDDLKRLNYRSNSPTYKFHPVPE